jgi:flagellar biogenesis protein FliO
MLRSIKSVLIGILVAVGTTPILAQSYGTAGPPAWQDGASAYLVSHGPAANSSENSPQTAPIEYGTSAQSTPAQLPIAAPQFVDRDVVPATHTAAIPPDAAQADRYLAPPSDAFPTSAAHASGASEQGSHGALSAVDTGVPSRSLYTVACALTIVIGLFLVCAWLLRRGTSSSTATLPADVVSVLGRVSLAARQSALLLRVGNKLVLVSLSPGGAETITEVTEPAEVDRLAGLCQQSNPHSTTKAFEQTFQQLAQERAPGGFFGNDPLPPALSLPADLGLFRTPRGEAARA